MLRTMNDQDTRRCGTRVRLREGSRDSVPVKECMFQRQSRFNAVLDLMEGGAEFGNF